MFLSLYTGAQMWFDGLRTRVREQDGATAVEYALMVALIAAVIIVAVQFLGHASSNTFSSVAGAVDGAGS